ncbi:wall-associated receptor kinase 2-like [Panicum miliaceum]|uniref:Wall-associated receptor kinase 2-like n=1 Tax=Panicum miliaceum TaxID=4540 RepID=A0A3L6R1C8_PANMI|nr:wall-associated receptor kinase 2-like [Panicum miliaceum]
MAWPTSGSNSTYILSEQHNQFVVTGYNVQGMLLGDSGNIITGCSSFCSIRDTWINPMYLDPNHENDGMLPMAVHVAERGWFHSIATHMLDNSARNSVLQTAVPVVLEWAVASTRIVPPGMTFPDGSSGSNSSCPIDAARSACRSSHSICHNVIDNYRTGYVCRCKDGYDDNPYLDGGGGCQDINECALSVKCFCVCTNTAGSYDCRCPRGARGNPYIADSCIKSSLGLSVDIGVGSWAGLLVLAVGAA